MMKAPSPVTMGKLHSLVPTAVVLATCGEIQSDNSVPRFDQVSTNEWDASAAQHIDSGQVNTRECVHISSATSLCSKSSKVAFGVLNLALAPLGSWAIARRDNITPNAPKRRVHYTSVSDWATVESDGPTRYHFVGASFEARSTLVTPDNGEIYPQSKRLAGTQLLKFIERLPSQLH